MVHPGDHTRLSREDGLLEVAIDATAHRHVVDGTPRDEAIADLISIATQQPPRSRAKRSFYEFYRPRLRLDLVAYAAGHHLAVARHDHMDAYRDWAAAAHQLLLETAEQAGGLTDEHRQILIDAYDWVRGNITRPYRPGIGNPPISRERP